MTNTPQPTYRIVDQESGKELRPYQTTADRDAFIQSRGLRIVNSNRDSITFNLHSVYVGA